MKYNLTDEQLLEHIPRDLYQAYTKANAYPSTQHQETDHKEVSSDNRRSANYRYGDATYKVITYEEALALINEDPHNVEYIRGIKDGELVEYEYQGNKYYPLYANSTRPVSYEKPNGDIVTKKNIRYITNPKIWLKLLDKIYWTDEYDHQLTQDEIAARQEKSQITAFGQFTPTSDLQYNRFRPLDHYTKNIKAIRRDTPDTGSHRTSGRYKYSTASGNHMEFSDETRKVVRLDQDTHDLVAKYEELYGLKSETFIQMNAARKALKKLERDRDDFDDQEYEQLFNAYNSNYKQYLSDYQDIALDLSRVKTQLDKYYESAGNEFVKKYSNVIAQLQEALSKCEDLKKHIDDLASKAVDSLTTSSMKAGWRSPEGDLIDTIKQLSTEVTNLISQLQELQKDAKEIDSDTDELTVDKSSEIEAKLSEITEKTAALNAVKRQLFNLYNNVYKKAHKEMADIEAAVNALKPTLAAKKAAKAAKAGQAVLDPAIADIIKFEDDVEETESATA